MFSTTNEDLTVYKKDHMIRIFLLKMCSSTSLVNNYSTLVKITIFMIQGIILVLLDTEKSLFHDYISPSVPRKPQLPLC